MDIIDSHTHVLFSERMGRAPLPPHQLVGQFRRRGITGIFISAIDGLISNNSAVHKECNNKVAGLQEEFREFIHGFCTVNPNDGKDAADELRRSVEELGIKGLKLHPWLQSFSVTNPNLPPLMEEAQRLEVPVLFHDGTPPYSTPFQIGCLAELYPKLTIILGHSGLKDLWQNSLTVALNHPRVYLCTCASPFLAVLKMVETVGAERVLYGSDAGFGNPAWMDYGLKKIEYLSIPEQSKAKILGGTALRVLGDCGQYKGA